MRTVFPFRSLMLWATLGGLLGGASGATFAQRGARAQAPARPRSAPMVRRTLPPAPRGSGRQQAGAPIERRAPVAGPMAGPNPAANPKGHLGEWMNQHGNLAPGQQQQALEREPGFRQLPPDQQQRMRERLTQLNAMSPQQRQRTLERTEMMERLSPDQRVQVRGAMQQLGSLPPDQRQSVARSFRELRELPPEQRAAAMNSDRYRNLNETQRATLNNLIRVEPMLPPPEPVGPR
jgi:hypothetical protein